MNKERYSFAVGEGLDWSCLVVSSNSSCFATPVLIFGIDFFFLRGPSFPQGPFHMRRMSDCCYPHIPVYRTKRADIPFLSTHNVGIGAP